MTNKCVKRFSYWCNCILHLTKWEGILTVHQTGNTTKTKGQYSAPCLQEREARGSSDRGGTEVL